MVGRPASLVASLLLCAGCAGCAGDRLVMPNSDEIFVYVVLAPDAASPASRDLHAWLFKAGTPIRSPFLTATRFEMRRASDGSLFDWRLVPTADSIVVAATAVDSRDGNYSLPRVGTSGRLGRADLQADETYTLLVEVGGRTVTGQVTIPGVPVISRTPELANADSLIWRRVAGAGGYSVDTQDFYPIFDFTTDTVFRFDSRILNHGTVVRAYESQLFAYTVDERVGRAGVVGALGVFGAYNADSLPRRNQAITATVGQNLGRHR